MKDLNILIPLPPVTKKNHSQIIRVQGRPMLIPSKQYKTYEKACAEYMPKMEHPLGSEYNVRCIYYMPTHRRVDLTNLLAATMDMLVKHGVLEDDNANIVVSVDGSLVKYDKNNPRTEITITEIPF